MSGRFLKPNSCSMAAASKVSFRPSCAVRSSRSDCGQRKSSPSLKPPRKRDSFIEDVRGLNHAEIIRAAVAGKKNILTVGASGSGKTTFVNAVLDVMAEVAPNDRVVSIEDTTELQCSVQNHVDLLA